jgi:hypothetical protein
VNFCLHTFVEFRVLRRQRGSERERGKQRKLREDTTTSGGGNDRAREPTREGCACEGKQKVLSARNGAHVHSPLPPPLPYLPDTYIHRYIRSDLLQARHVRRTCSLQTSQTYSLFSVLL